MSNRIEQLLNTWHQDKDNLRWMLATVVETAGSSYRKKGAMMLFNDMGQYFGLVSGGCLEADIMRQARKNWDTNQASVLTYDMREEDDIGWQLGIGCGGMVKLLLQPISKDNDYLELDKLRNTLEQRQSCYYLQSLDSTGKNQVVSVEPKVVSDSQKLHHFHPKPQIVIFGGGVDAIPVIEIGHTLGWQQILIDKRVGYARPSVFNKADTIYSSPTESIDIQPLLRSAEAIVIMTHNVSYDAEVLKWAQASNAGFIGLLGPKHRTEKVLKAAQLSYDNLRKPLANPIGLDLGGELPEAIALSITSQIQGVLEGKIALSNKTELKRVI